jgi:hypothetical protein
MCENKEVIFHLQPWMVSKIVSLFLVLELIHYYACLFKLPFIGLTQLTETNTKRLDNSISFSVSLRCN